MVKVEVKIRGSPMRPERATSIGLEVGALEVQAVGHHQLDAALRAPRRPCARTRSSVTAIGFSHSTCMPARAARIGVLGVQVVRQRDVDRVDLAALQQLVVLRRSR